MKLRVHENKIAKSISNKKIPSHRTAALEISISPWKLHGESAYKRANDEPKNSISAGGNEVEDMDEAQGQHLRVSI